MTAVYKQDLLIIDNVSKQYGDNLVLRNISHTVRDVYNDDTDTGQVIGLLARSGVGKSTMFKMMAGLEPTSTGTIKYLSGEQMIPVHAGCMGIVTQKYTVSNHRTVESNLLLAANRNPEIQDKKAAVKESLEKYLLADKGKLYPEQLSGGQRQRVAIARAVLAGSKFLLMDEPFSGLDPIMIEKVCRVIKDIAAADGLATIFVVTHDVEAAVVVSDTLLCLGYDYEPNGNNIPGAYIKYQYNLAEMGLAWKENISETQEFHDFMKELYEVYHKL